MAPTLQQKALEHQIKLLFAEDALSHTANSKEYVFVLFKPMAVKTGRNETFKRALEGLGAVFEQCELRRVTKSQITKHYQEHVGKNFFDALLEYYTGKVIEACRVSGPPGILSKIRQKMGPWNPNKCIPGEHLRAESIPYAKVDPSCGLDNFIHASDSPGAAIREMKVWGVAPSKMAAAYSGNLGLVEMMKFYEVADRNQKALMERLLENGKTKAAWELLKRVSRLDLSNIPNLKSGDARSKDAGWWATRPNDHGAGEVLYNGDGPADLMDHALKEIIRAYGTSLGRKPYVEEIQAVFDFCSNPVMHHDNGIKSVIDRVAHRYTNADDYGCTYTGCK